MEEVKGDKLIEKYVDKVPEKKKDPSHVGGSFGKKEDQIDKLRMNKLGLDSARDY